MYYLRGFLPWIAFATIPHWQWGALVGLVLAILLLAQDVINGNSTESLILEISTIVYLALIGVLALVDYSSPIREYVGALSMGWLALTAWGGLVAGSPFTTGVAKRQAPELVWEHPIFKRMNIVLTTVWAVFFTLSAAGVIIAIFAHLGSWSHIVVEVAGFIIPAVFTARYSKWGAGEIQRSYAGQVPAENPTR